MAEIEGEALMSKERKLHRGSWNLKPLAWGMLVAALAVCAIPRTAAGQNTPAVVTGS